MKKYEDAELEIIAFSAEDIITTSEIVDIPVDSDDTDF